MIIEELQDDDNNVEFANMPPLLNVPSPIYLSHTEPPFLYQYVGDQVKIIQVLGDFPLGENCNRKRGNTVDKTIDDKNISHDIFKNVDKEAQENKDEDVDKQKIVSNYIDSNIPANEKDKEFKSNVVNTVETVSNNQNTSIDKDESKEDIAPKPDKDLVKDNKDTASIDDTSLHENDSAESDDEASFGTPDNSPKSRRKSSKARYGKSKAPLPPIDVSIKNSEDWIDTTTVDSATSQESLVDIVNKMPNVAFKDSGNFRVHQVVNPIAEKKRRHKSKSPSIIPKSNSSGLSKLLQLPGKLAFWYKSDDKSLNPDISNLSSNSTRSSNIEQAIDDFQSCTDLTKMALASEIIISNADKDDQISLHDADTESISQEIIEKSDALQKTIEAKLETHPEYKTDVIKDEIPTTSKSTEV